MGFAGSLIMSSSKGFSSKNIGEINNQESSNSPKQRYNEERLRSTFHNTVNGKFIDFPPLNERNENSNYYPPTRSSMKDFSNNLTTKSNEGISNQTSTNFYSERNKLPDLVVTRQSQERPQKRGRPNCLGLDLRPDTPINVIKIT